MGLQDIGVRAVIEGLDGYTSGMAKMQNATNETAKATDGLAESGKDQAKVITTNMRPALTAVSSLFHIMASSMLFAMASNGKMSETMQTTMKVLTGISLAVAAATALYRLYAAQAAIATAAQIAFNVAVAANPIGFAVLAVAVVVTALVLLISKLSETTSEADRLKAKLKEQSAAFKESKTAIDETRKSLGALVDEMEYLSDPRLEGMQAYEDQIFQIDEEVKKLQLQEAQYGKSEGVTAAIDEWERQRRVLELTRDIKFDPLTRQAKEAAETVKGLNDEMTPEEWLTRMTSVEGQIGAEATKIGELIGTNLTSATLRQIDAAVAEWIARSEASIKATEDEIKRKAAEKKARAQASYNEPAVGGGMPGGLQYGGHSAYGGATWVGERGRELVVLPAGAAVMPSNTVNYNVNAHYTNPQQPQSIGQDLEAIRMMSRV